MKKQREFNWENEDGVVVDDGVYRWTSLEGKPSSANKLDFGFEEDTGILYYWTGTEWKEVGSALPPVQFITPVASLGSENDNFNIVFTGNYERKVIDERECFVPIYRATNTETLYEYESHAVELSFEYNDGADSVIAYLDDETIESPFDADLSEPIQLYFEDSNTDKKYGAIINVEAELTPNPAVEITEGSFRTNEETPSILNFTAENNKLLISAQQPADNVLLNGIVYNPDSERVKLYIGKSVEEEHQYSAWTPQTEIEASDRLLPIFIGEDVSEDNHNYYDLEYQTTKKKRGKK